MIHRPINRPKTQPFSEHVEVFGQTLSVNATIVFNWENEIESVRIDQVSVAGWTEGQGLAFLVDITAEIDPAAENELKNALLNQFTDEIMESRANYENEN